ncbi:MAG TPA: TonB-dependent receptor [Acidobacteriaceae bacterium]
MNHIVRKSVFILGILAVSLLTASAQVDQGAIIGVVRDSTGAVIPGAQLTLTNTDTNLVLQGSSGSSGNYVFSPLKIGNYSLSVTAKGFATSTQQNLHVEAQSKVNLEIVLKPGETTQQIVVSTEPPLIQSEEASVGQTLNTQTINNTPLNGRNWIYIAQLTAGATPSISGQSRGGGSGDFFANGQRATQNDFVLDGVDNNINDIDFMNGTSYSVRPPPDALAEFKVETSNYSAEFGHSAGAVLNASIKSGTNQVHGSAWEYIRNTIFDAKDWPALSIPKYNENQFGATLGFPIFRNKLFYFGDIESNRIVVGVPATASVPTALMRLGNFTELLNTALTGSAKAITLYQPNSGGKQLLTCNGQANVFCASQLDQVAVTMLNLYPLPNTGNGRTTNNFVTNATNHSNTIQWDQRLDWNPSSRDQAYARLSYDHVQNNNPPSLGPIIGNGTSHVTIVAENTMGSETHSFNPTLTNEARFGYNWGAFFNLQQNFDRNVATGLGIGGVPTGPGFPYNGGLPAGAIGGITTFGTGASVPSVEHQNVYQILDNLTKIAGRHSLRIGLDLQSVRMAFLQPPASRGIYNYTGLYTSNLNASFTGYGVADFLANQMNSAQLSNESTVNDTRWYRSGYFEDDWKITDKLTLNLGLRYDFYQPWVENGDGQANFVVNTSGIGTGTATLLYPKSRANTYLAPAFLSLLTSNHVTVAYTPERSLVSSQKKNFAPRFGFAYSVNPSTVIRAGYGIFYGGLESFGSVNLGESYPFQFTGGVVAPSCTVTSCVSDGITLENGFSTQIAAGLQNFASTPSIQGAQANYQTAYTMNYNLSLERGFTNSLVGTLSYVGNASRHLLTLVNPNAPNALVNPANSSLLVQPFPGLGRDIASTDTGESNYNGLQAKLQKRLTHGLDFLANYTLSHALDNSVSPIEPNAAQREYNLIPQSEEYTNSIWDVRQRVTLNAYYAIPFGAGQAHTLNNKALDFVAGGWAASLTFVAQTGNPFTVTPNITAAPAGSGGSARAFRVRDPFAAGGSADPTNQTVTCAPSTRNRTNWYNPCAFANPLPGNTIPQTGVGSQVTGLSNAVAYLGGRANLVYGPGYNRTNMSLFKRFTAFRETYVEFRADIFNVLNHPSLNQPSTLTNNTNGGQITAAKSFQSNTPDARFFQLSGKYVF